MLLSNGKKRKPCSEDQKKKQSEAMRGRTVSEETKEKMRATHKKLGTRPPSWEGKNHSEETLKKMSEAQRKVKPRRNGQLSPYNRRQALTRDDYTCQICGLREPEIMQVDHTKPRSEFPELADDLNNLLTLCPNCHARKTNRDRRAYNWNPNS